MTNLGGVDVVHWNPRRPVIPGRLGAAIPLRKRVNNFGDLLGPIVVSSLSGTDAPKPTVSARLLAVGSIMHFAENGDVVWGAGVNGKVPLTEITARQLDVRAVRGPRTAAVLAQFGVEVPEVFGDPGLLAPSTLGVNRAAVSRTAVAIVPNMHDERRWRSCPGFVSPRGEPRKVLQRIAEADLVIASSLHGLVMADALAIPASLLRPDKEDLFKYRDYYEGTGRELPAVSDTIAAARAQPAPPPQWSPEALLRAFPRDLWARS